MLVRHSDNQLSVIINPTLRCNHDCPYCYHLQDDRHEDRVLDLDKLDRLFTILAKRYNFLDIYWSGGEPSLLPVAYYRKATKILKSYYHEEGAVRNYIYTNGEDVDRGYVRKLQKLGFKWTVSPVTEVGAWFEKHPEFDKENVSVYSHVVTSDNFRELINDYKTLRVKVKNIKLRFIDPLGESSIDSSHVPDYVLLAETMIELFDIWVMDANGPILDPLIGYLESVMSGEGRGICMNTECFGRFLSIVPNGNVYPCGKGCHDRYLLGNIQEVQSIEEIFGSRGMKVFMADYLRKAEGCTACKYSCLCKGGCILEINLNNEELSGSARCYYHKKVFAHIEEFLERIRAKSIDIKTLNPFIRDMFIRWLITYSG